MKKLFLLGAMLVCGLVANAQIVFTPQVGATMSTITEDDDAKMKFGLVAGGNIELPASELLSFSGGLLYSMQGCKYDDESLKLEYLNIPILAQYQIAEGFKIKAGVQPGILMSAKVGDYDYKDNCKSLDWSIPLGFSYDFQDFVIDARYNLGLSKINEKVSKSYKNSVFMITIGYKIPFMRYY